MSWEIPLLRLFSELISCVNPVRPRSKPCPWDANPHLIDPQKVARYQDRLAASDHYNYNGETEWPGLTTTMMPDGSILEGTYNELWDENPWTTQFRCKLCPDAIGLQADIAVGDDWAGAVPAGEDEGWIALIALTEIGIEVLNSCEAADEIALFEAGVEHLNDVQPHHVKLRKGIKSRMAACADMDLPALNFWGLNLDDCSGQLSSDEREKVRKGTAERVRKRHGDNDLMVDSASYLDGGLPARTIT